MKPPHVKLPYWDENSKFAEVLCFVLSLPYTPLALLSSPRPLMKHISLLFILLFAWSFADAQSDPTWRSWNQPVEPFRIIGNIYYVGASDITSFLITSPQGHILLDGGFPETAPMIRDNIRKLGFKVEDVKYLLSSHGHFDHAGGLALLKTWTGAKFVASREDGALIARGGHDDFAWGDKYAFPPVKPDQTIADGDNVAIGNAVMTAHITPGHTKGCTTWTTRAEENSKPYNVVFVCSTSAPGYKLVNNAKYPNIVNDYRKTFQSLKSLPCDVFLGAHGAFFHLADKRAALKADPKQNPFVNAAEYQEYLKQAESDFETKVREQQQGHAPQ
jgi:metallo-beta-lactamase class B